VRANYSVLFVRPLGGDLPAKPRHTYFGSSMAPVAAPPACPTRANTPTLWLHPHVFAMPVASHLAHCHTTRTHSS
jgi:hypothetical protein